MQTNRLSRLATNSTSFTRFWNSDISQLLKAKLAEIPNAEDFDSVAPHYLSSDLLADAVIEHFQWNYKDYHTIKKWVFEVDFDNISNLPLAAQKLLKPIIAVPDWHDHELISLATNACNRSGGQAFWVLRNYCLMGGYQSSAINKPLIFSGALKKGPTKRMTDTLDFWMSVTQNHNLAVGNEGFRYALYVRLSHALSRKLIIEHPNWETPNWGLPINQADMMATNLGFSIVFIHGLKRLGLQFTDLEVKAILHLWKYIGWLLGIDLALLPDTEAEAVRLLYIWTIKQPSIDADTRALAKALMLAPMEGTFPQKKWQKRILINVHNSLYNYFLGSETAREMGLPISKFYISPYLIKLTNIISAHFTNTFYSSNHAIHTGRKEQEYVHQEFLKSVANL